MPFFFKVFQKNEEDTFKLFLKKEQFNFFFSVPKFIFYAPHPVLRAIHALLNTHHQAHPTPHPPHLQNPQFVSQSPQSLIVLILVTSPNGSGVSDSIHCWEGL